MTQKKRIIIQLQTMLDSARFRLKENNNDEIARADIEALEYAIYIVYSEGDC